MSLTSALSNVGNSLLGTNKKAVLLLHDLQTSNSSSLLGSSVNSLTKKVLSAANNIGGSAFATAANALVGGGGSLEVQYNPSSLSINANANPVPFSYLLKNTDNGIPNQDLRPPSITLSVQLVFDDMNVKDAFMADKFRVTSVGDAISTASALAKNLSGNGYSVQPETNALVAMLMKDSTRLVTFQWADMSFTGEVCQVQARYTMFSVSGQPIRSVVDLVIVQAITSSGDVTQWENAFDKSFADSLAACSTGKSLLQKAGNLINITGF